MSTASNPGHFTPPPGVPLERIADVLGHDGTRMTALIYRHHISPTINDAAHMGDALRAT